MRLIKKRELFALSNFAYIAAAAKAGLKIFREDLFINFAEMDQEITSAEDKMTDAAARLWLKEVRKALNQVESRADLERVDLQDLKDGLTGIYLQMTGSVWEYGQQAADQELQDMGVDKSAEIRSFAAGDPSELETGLNDDAYEWYQEYYQKLSDEGVEAVFIRMIPQILEAIDEGRAGKQLSALLAADFARYGAVRADIIARTESTKAYNWGRRYRFDRSEALAGYRYSAIMDARTTSICKGLHGSSWEKGDPSINLYTPPNHYRCRSILVPIHKFRDFTFSPPDPDWLDDIPEKDRALLERFTDASFYPVSVMG